LPVGLGICGPAPRRKPRRERRVEFSSRFGARKTKGWRVCHDVRDVLHGHDSHFGFLEWLIGIVAGVTVAVGVLYFNIQKYAVIVMTAMAGTGVIVFTFLAAFGNLSLVDLLLGPVRLALQNSFWWLLFFIVFYGIGIFSQILASREYEAKVYNRMATV
jgi:hypothetical protein